uniref:3-oxoacyl-[acyl-carrier-protein] synthase n=1 Tax=Compsopogon caeruleus TaxID=31354 RepID=A0A6T6BCS4_9RHOD|mmetsp:Transcript_12615/g.25603  ORF Transcript_12615/g.25603 Transcript_12615/m.25603 type:complete len:467 (+) Transcript_12615:82-1482(+)|eukprot:CAMPEP_0184678798 /NCGR_PEP_ID=MMETSP0312-20130426/1589_1 /TAXON_ID=31354 /ORGANISM="Compsopogon coeruleus, Strain SAG 36.94" /LENGTH=466 /DNA_ID=CAMNT_0027127811 /DNA_START=26 /DNA_END=1426 /DNA_ORIENTATION=-
MAFASTIGAEQVARPPLSKIELGRRSSLVSRRSGRWTAAVDRSALSDNQRVVITGLGVTSVFGNDVNVFHESLVAGKSGIRKIQGFDTEGWPTNFAGEIPQELISTEGYIAPKAARRLDPCIMYTILTGKKALEDAGLPLGGEAFEALDKTRCGVLVGTGMGGLRVIEENVTKLAIKGFKSVSPFFIPYAITNMGSGLLAIDLGFMGPNYSISTACATGNYAINNAAIHLKRGDADLILAGGSEAAVVPMGLAGFISCRALSTNGSDPTAASRPWDKNRDGFVLGEGAGVLVMETLEHAKRRGAKIYAEYLGGAQSCDAHHMTEPRQDGSAVKLCIEKALVDAGVSKEQVNYINAHATSTPAGDLAEFRAIRQVFSGNVERLRMNATKSLIGHGLGAAGGLEAVATIKAIETSRVHPTLNADNTEDEVDIDIVANVAQTHEIEVGMSNSFGFGGHNSSVLFTKYVE